MKKSMLSVIVLGACLSLASVLRGQTPELEFVDSLLREQEKSDFKFWDAGHQQLPGGSLIRGLLDVTGDGQEDLLLCSSIDSEFQWSLFVAEDGGYSFRSRDIKLQGPAGRFRVAGGLTFLTDLSMRPDWLGIIENQIDSRGTVRVRREIIEGYARVQERKEQPGWPNEVFGEGVRFSNPEVVTLREFLEKSDAPWRSYSFDHPLYSQEEAMPEPLRLHLRQTVFTPEDAKKALEKMRKTGAVSPTDSSKRREIRTAANPLNVERGESAVEEGLSSSSNGVELSEGRADLRWVAGGIVAATAILVGLFRRRR